MSDAAFYTDEEIAAFAAEQNCTVEEFKNRWIITNVGDYYLYGPNGYMSPVKMSDLGVSLKHDLAPVPPASKSKAGIDWEIPWGTSVKRKPTSTIIEDHGRNARKIVAHLAINKSYFVEDPDGGIFYKKVCPLRNLPAVFDPDVDRWMRLLGGKDAETLLDWVATVTNLSRVTCAIYLHGSKDHGKTMFANGIARLWGEAPTELESAASDFNSAILDNPIVFADEEIPPKMTSGFLRKFVGSKSRPLKQKNIAESTIMGAIRLIIAANNENLLKFDDEEFSPDDINAVAARILYIKCDPGTGDFLKSLGGTEGTINWLDGGDPANNDRIAKHATWLKENREVKEGMRFLVEGEMDMIHRKLATNGSIRSLAMEWVCKALLVSWTEKNPGIQFGGGELYVNVSFAKQTWEQLTDDKRVPSLSKIGRAFKPLSVGEKRLMLNSRRADFYKIDVTHIYDAAKELQIATVEEFEKLINRPVLITDGGGESGGSAPITRFEPAPPSGNRLASGTGSANPLADIFPSPIRGSSLFDSDASKPSKK